MSNWRSWFIIVLYTSLVLGLGLGAGYLLRGNEARAPIIIENR